MLIWPKAKLIWPDYELLACKSLTRGTQDPLQRERCCLFC